jgi:hypothetical protein
LWDVGLVGCRTCGTSDLWDVGLVGCRTCGMSDLWDVGLVGCRTYGGESAYRRSGTTVQPTEYETGLDHAHSETALKCRHV